MVSTDSKEFWLESIGTLKSISTVLTDGCLDPFELSGIPIIPGFVGYRSKMKDLTVSDRICELNYNSFISI